MLERIADYSINRLPEVLPWNLATTLPISSRIRSHSRVGWLCDGKLVQTRRTPAEVSRQGTTTEDDNEVRSFPERGRRIAGAFFPLTNSHRFVVAYR